MCVGCCVNKSGTIKWDSCTTWYFSAFSHLWLYKMQLLILSPPFFSFFLLFCLFARAKIDIWTEDTLDLDNQIYDRDVKQCSNNYQRIHTHTHIGYIVSMITINSRRVDWHTRSAHTWLCENKKPNKTNNTQPWERKKKKCIHTDGTYENWKKEQKNDTY